MLANRQITKSNLEPYNHEERDTRLFVHVRDAALTNIQKVTIIENDTDIVVIALCNFGSNMVVERIAGGYQYISM